MSKNKVKAVLFDLDGVLVDSANAWFLVINDALRHFGFRKISLAIFKKRFGAPIEEDVKILFRGKTIKEVEAIYNKRFKKRSKNVKLFPQTRMVLENLSKLDIRLGLISNSTKLIVLAILNRYKLRKYFHVIVTMDDVKRRKPSPDMALKACRILKVKPKNTILVGDTKNDMIASKRAGCIAVGYKIKGEYQINYLKEIERFICAN